MNRTVLLAAALLLAGSLPIGAASATQPANVLPSGPPPVREHTGVPPLPPSGGGYVYDPQTGQYTAEGGQAIWVPGHNENGKWVEGQWMYKKPATGGYGR
jgi:hypothetical protein